ncbi:acetyl-CoA carboxylase biotin carboxyl carrier protein [Sphingobium sp. ba1]|jgi:acetyl-CoA carboxylase biotin carboxyl carrier protein|uniref:acetyl-CoA carboxylase biotin carboxyl carrier protein n=1 Tax=unclassified Sphingobium TaxID=2611147 RepID=UPI00050577FA|nr:MULTISPECIES: acetyl-CoA carboxylase biotin carboxyl carrier protein [unclassified Sphingobium]KFL48290.1 acetyl-CoA carboxylase biotin carboxyl carrier protein [Sphingobium sp. ba1]PBN41894.1 acetyl-CoA carboxylase biotin carboxyl carrier protein subunit [Sphingobium sp. D43FB]
MNDKQDKGAMQVDVTLVRELAALLDDTNLTEIEVEDGDRKIRVARKAGAMAPVYAAPPAAPVAAAPVAAPVAAAEPAMPAGTLVRSPIVGTAYLSAEPGAAPFARIGSQVAAGETVLIVEAMKVMNAIPAPVSGTVKAVFVDNGQPVEFDQPLIVIE